MAVVRYSVNHTDRGVTATVTVERRIVTLRWRLSHADMPLEFTKEPARERRIYPMRRRRRR